MQAQGENIMSLLIYSTNDGKLSEFRKLLGPHATFQEALHLRRCQELTGKVAEECPESYSTFLQNGLQKLTYALNYTSQINHILSQPIGQILVDDSGLCVPDLAFSPGVQSAYYGGKPRSDLANRQHLISQLKALDSSGDSVEKQAFFVSVLLFLSWGDPQNGPNIDLTPLLQTSADKEQALLLEASQNPTKQGHHLVLNPPGGAFPYHQLTIVYGFCFGKVKSVEQNLIPGAGHGYDSLFYPTAHPELSFASIPMERKNQLSHRGLALNGLIRALPA